MFEDLNRVWDELMPIYNGEFKNLVYGELPTDQAVLGTMKKIKERLAGVTWTIKINGR